MGSLRSHNRSSDLRYMLITVLTESSELLRQLSKRRGVVQSTEEQSVTGTRAEVAEEGGAAAAQLCSALGRVRRLPGEVLLPRWLWAVSPTATVTAVRDQPHHPQLPPHFGAHSSSPEE